MAKASDNVFPRLLISEGGSTSTPASGNVTVYAKASGLLFSKDDAGAETALGGLQDQGAFTYLDATEAAAPGTPASGKVRVYAKTDGRIYSKDDGGVEYGPFDAAGTGGDLSVLRLASVSDDPDDIPLGTYGDEFEYESRADAVTAGWTASNSLPDSSWRAAGSELILTMDDATGGRGIYLDAGGNLPDDFEVAALFSGSDQNGNMMALGILDSSGNGYAVSGNYAGAGYSWVVTSYAYGSTGGTGTALTLAQMNAPHWLAIRRSSATTWRFRWSADGASWTTIIASESRTVTNARRIFIGPLFTNGAAGNVSIHRLVYGTADLGL